MTLRPRYPMLAVLIAATATPARADLPKAGDLIAKGLAKYDHARTYQGTIEVQSLSPAADTTMTVAARVENDGLGHIRRSSFSMTTKEMAGGTEHTETEVTIDDGQNEVTVYPERKEYRREPSTPGRASDVLRSAIDKCTKLAGELEVTTRVAKGRPTYVLAKDTPDGRVEIVLDRATLRFESIHAMHRDGAAKTVADVTLSKQVFDQPIAASAFKWHALAGYREVRQE